MFENDRIRHHPSLQLLHASLRRMRLLSENTTMHVVIVGRTTIVQWRCHSVSRIRSGHRSRGSGTGQEMVRTSRGKSRVIGTINNG